MPYKEKPLTEAQIRVLARVRQRLGEWTVFHAGHENRTAHSLVKRGLLKHKRVNNGQKTRTPPGPWKIVYEDGFKEVQTKGKVRR